LVEFALAAPFVLVLVAGGGQVGALAYGMVTLDTAAREGARIGSEKPANSLLTAAGNAPGFTYQCSYATDSQPTGNPICQAVYGAMGLLDKTKVRVKVTTNLTVSSLVVRDDVIRISSTPTPAPCGSDAEVDGTVVMPGGTAPTQAVSISSNAAGTVTSATVAAGTTSYRLCLKVQSHTTQINATIAPVGCGGYAGQTTVNITDNSSPYTAATITLAANACATPTPTPTPTATPTPTSTPAPTPTPVSTPLSTPPPFACSNTSASTTTFFSVYIEYDVPVFVPFVDRIFSSSNGMRTVNATVAQRVEPCGITQGQ
jgi:hypothetical protein